jgi:RNA recognition motif-containing protein
MKLYVGNLSHTITETDLGALFSPHGSIEKINVIRDHYTRQSKCFGYVQMADNKEGRTAMRILHGTKMNDRLLIIKEARSRDERDGLPW